AFKGRASGLPTIFSPASRTATVRASTVPASRLNAARTLSTPSSFTSQDMVRSLSLRVEIQSKSEFGGRPFERHRLGVGAGVPVALDVLVFRARGFTPYGPLGRQDRQADDDDAAAADGRNGPDFGRPARGEVIQIANGGVPLDVGDHNPPLRARPDVSLGQVPRQVGDDGGDGTGSLRRLDRRRP